MTVKFEENIYSFRASTSLLHGRSVLVYSGDDGAPAGAQTLADVEATLASAHDAYVQRRYQDAIDAYKAAGATIFSYLETLPSISGLFYDSLSVDPRLLDSLLSVSTEYLNVLPLPHAPDVGPRVAPDPQALGDVRAAQLGLHSTQLVSPSARSAFADLQSAARLEALGLIDNAAFYSTRAAAVDPALAELLAGPANPPANPAAPAPGPAAPAPQGIQEIAGNRELLSAAPLNFMQTPLSLHISAQAAKGISALQAAGGVAGEIAAVNLVGNGGQAGVAAGLPSALLEARTVGVLVNDTVVQLNWNQGDTAPIDAVKTKLYQSRINLVSMLGDTLLHPQTAADVALALGHDYYYVIPLGIAESLHALGDYQHAEQYYLQAASYQYLNVNVEASYLWLRLATLYLDWGNSLFIDGNPQDASPIYVNVLNSDSSAPGSHLYTIAGLGVPAGVARQVIAALADVSKLPSTINPALTAAIVEIHQQLIKIANGLDYWGSSANNVPIWTFDYLQSVAVNFAQLAISAEKDFVSYQERADQATVTRENLAQSTTTSQAEVAAAQLQANAASAEVDAYQWGVSLANQRASDANTAVAAYAGASWTQIQYQASSAQISGGDDGDPNTLNSLADALLSGNSLDGSKATIAAATQLAGSKANRDYEIGSMQRTAAEMGTAAGQAQAELTAAQARQDAANAGVTVAQLRADASQAVLDTFDASYFTPDVWYAMGQTMYRLYRRYFTMAQRVAKDMQKAYNFETDESLHLIRSDYGSDEVKGLLAADSLMADIESFTYDLVTATRGKPQPLRHTISLASRYPFLFETQFRKTGVMQFETRIDDFDAAYPGTYAGRIEAVEVLADGIVPVTGIAGTLTNSGISSYRLPSSSWPADGSPGVKFRIQSRETLVVSDYATRDDELLFTPENRMLRIFEGSGVASSWRLEVPRAVNDIDFGALTDVRLVFYYRARFDLNLKDRVLQNLSALPGVTHKSRSLPLRWLYQDAFYHFQQTGNLQFSLVARDFPVNETQPRLSKVAVLVATDQTKPASNIALTVSTPGQAAVAATTDASGLVASNGAAALNALIGGSALGAYSVSIAAANNAQLVTAGQLDLSSIINMALIFEYEFTPRP